MKELIKQIRNATKMSQEQFATAIGTTLVSINRWENGKTVPTNLAQNKLFEFCVDRGIDCTSIILEKYRLENSDGKQILYHGSKKGITGEIAPISRKDCDFGCGFYMGTDALQPLALICTEETPKFYRIAYDLTDIKVKEIDIGMDWAMLIAFNRGYMKGFENTAIYQKYANYLNGCDLAVGYIANDRMYTELTRFFDGTITDTVLMKCLSALDLGRQYVALTEKGCRAAKVIDGQTVSHLELLLLRDYSAKRRKDGLCVADEIEKQYRREGKYFDEILRGE